jgi:penicillin-binding protein-related factor A (putative recombinase)
MKESKFATEVIRSLRYNKAWAYKIPDSPITKEILKVTRFTAAKPCDIVASIESKFVGIETKQFKKWKSLSLRDFRPEQIAALTDIIETGKGRAFVFLNIRIRSPYENRLIIFDWATWGPRLKQKSIHAKDLKARYFYKHFTHNDKIVFDLTDWLLLL